MKEFRNEVITIFKTKKTVFLKKRFQNDTFCPEGMINLISIGSSSIDT